MRRVAALAEPRGPGGDRQLRPRQVDGEASLGALGLAVAVARLSVGHEAAPLHGSREGEVVRIHGERRGVEPNPTEGGVAGPVALVHLAVAVGAPLALVGTGLGVEQDLIVHLREVALLPGGQREVLRGAGGVHPEAEDAHVHAGHQERVLAVHRHLEGLSSLSTRRESARPPGALLPPLGPVFLGAHRPPRLLLVGVDAVDASPLPPLLAAGGLARLPRPDPPEEASRAVAQVALAGIARPLALAAALRHGLRVPPAEGVDGVAGDVPELQAGVAPLGALRPRGRGPAEGAGLRVTAPFLPGLGQALPQAVIAMNLHFP